LPINAYLNFAGNTRDVVLYYAKVFGLPEPQLMTFGSLPPNPEFPLPPGSEDLIMHASLDIDGSKLMFSDTFPGMPFQVGNNISLAFVTGDEAKARDIFEQFKDGGTVVMELQETFWSKVYGQVTDKFGILWQISHEENK
jgi:Uncharacterized protein conserved in bacteria